MKEPKFGIGDKVKIVKYGHAARFSDKSGWDMIPQIVGKEGLVSEVLLSQGEYSYSVKGIPEKHAWYYEDQLEMINRNPNR